MTDGVGRLRLSVTPSGMLLANEPPSSPHRPLLTPAPEPTTVVPLRLKEPVRCVSHLPYRRSHALMRPDQALTIATAAHDGQADKAGRPYIGHVHRVLGHLPDDATDDHRVVAALHDVVGVADVTLDQLRAHGLTDAQAAAVDAMTKRDGEPKDDYYRRVASNQIALVVKTADINDNADPARLAVLDPDDRSRLTAKYARARQALGLTGSG